MSADDEFRELYENAPCGLVTMAPDGTIERANTTFADLIGFPADEIVGRRFSDLLTVGSQLFYQTRFQPVLHLQGKVSEVVINLRTAAGTAQAVLVTALSVAAPDGTVASVRVALFDASGRQDYERDLLAARRAAESSEARVRSLQDASQQLAAVSTEDALGVVLARITKSALGASRTDIVLWDDGEVLPLEQTIGQHGFASVASAPLAQDGVELGELVSLFAADRSLDDHERELYAALARQGAQALTRIRLRTELERLALYDQLTGLANRRLLSERLEPFAGAGESAGAVALIVLDLDGFKTINDRHGHPVGDDALRQVAARIRHSVREDDVPGRIGGDEFIVFCQADEAAARSVAERLRAEIERPLDGVAATSVISASIGVAVRPAGHPEPVTPQRMFEVADAAMYESKKRGKNAVTVIRV